MNKTRVNSQFFRPQRNVNLDWPTRSEGVGQEKSFILRWSLIGVVQYAVCMSLAVIGGN